MFIEKFTEIREKDLSVTYRRTDPNCRKTSFLKIFVIEEFMTKKTKNQNMIGDVLVRIIEWLRFLYIIPNCFSNHDAGFKINETILTCNYNYLLRTDGLTLKRSHAFKTLRLRTLCLTP